MSFCDTGLGLDIKIEDEGSDTSEIESRCPSDEEYTYLSDISVASSDEFKTVEQSVTDVSCAEISKIIGIDLKIQPFDCKLELQPKAKKLKSVEQPVFCTRRPTRKAKKFKSTWVKVCSPESPVTLDDIASNFKVHNTGPRNCPNSHEPIEYFKLFVNDQLINEIAQETNNFAKVHVKNKKLLGKMKHYSKLKRWYDVTYDDMCKFLAVVLGMGLTWRDSLKKYWSVKPEESIPWFGQTMPLDRFMSIYTMLHVTSSRRSSKYDRLIKIRPFLDAVNEAFKRHFIPGQNLSISESLLIRNNNNKCDFIHYMERKGRAKHGIRKIELIDSSSMYTVHMALYSHKDYLDEFKGEQRHYCDPGAFTQKVVYDVLQSSKCLGKYYNVFTDLYTNVSLAEKLCEHDTFLTGPVKKSKKKRNSRYLPKQFSEGNLGEHESVYYRKGPTLLVGYSEEHSEEPTYMLSTAFNAEDIDIHRTSGLMTNKPQLIDLYNKLMIGLDYKNKTFNHFSCARPTTLYWRLFFCHLLDTCLLNAYILYAFHCNSEKGMSITNFVGELISSLACPVLPFLSHPVEHGTRHIQRLCKVCKKGESKPSCHGCSCMGHKKIF